jgi:RNA polymerase sigma-70 factor (ECF subfamily)
MHPTDEYILTLYKSEPHTAFTLLVKKYQKQLYYSIRRILLSHDDANDVTQDVFIKVWNNLSKFKGQSKIYTWIYRVAFNESLNHLNKKKKKRTEKIDDYNHELSQILDDDTKFTGDDIQKILYKAIGQLPEKQRLVFNLKYFNEFSYEEISKITNTSVGALKASYFHAIRKIEKIINGLH